MTLKDFLKEIDTLSEYYYVLVYNCLISENSKKQTCGLENRNNG